MGRRERDEDGKKRGGMRVGRTDGGMRMERRERDEGGKKRGGMRRKK